MKTLLLITLILALSFLSQAQKVKPLQSPGKNLNGQNAQGYCNVEFYKGNTLAYTASTDHYNKIVTRSSFSSTYDNQIDKIKYYGTRCYLWIELYKNTGYKGPSLGFWVGNGSGSFDLTYYNSYDQSGSGWFNWAKGLSSYTVYYY